VYVYSGAGVQPEDMRSSGASGAGHKPLTSTEVKQNSDGAYKYTVTFLPAGAYTLTFTCQASEDDPEAHDDIDFVPYGASTPS
jgi:hypothetical protein